MQGSSYKCACVIGPYLMTAELILSRLPKLETIGIPYNIDRNIVRGLDYYTKTVFEFVSENIGTKGTVCGGGRYDGLVEK